MPMTKVLITGMSGTGKSTVLRELGKRGHRVVDTDTDDWSHWVTAPDRARDWVWREPEIARLLAEHDEGVLFVAGCKSNQGRFYGQFDMVVLLSAPADVILERIARRDDNPYGKHADERAFVLHDLATIEPLLRGTSSHELDATAPVAAIAAQLEAIAAER
jgi:dephospho-CoA kinase